MKTNEGLLRKLNNTKIIKKTKSTQDIQIRVQEQELDLVRVSFMPPKLSLLLADVPDALTHMHLTRLESFLLSFVRGVHER